MTRTQDENAVWFQERIRIMASFCQSVAAARSDARLTTLVQQRLGGGFHGNAATRWGLQREAIAFS